MAQRPLTPPSWKMVGVTDEWSWVNNGNSKVVDLRRRSKKVPKPNEAPSEAPVAYTSLWLHRALVQMSTGCQFVERLPEPPPNQKQNPQTSFRTCATACFLWKAYLAGISAEFSEKPITNTRAKSGICALPPGKGASELRRIYYEQIHPLSLWKASDIPKLAAGFSCFTSGSLTLL
ncbi:hypothetical protein AAMO2058_000325500 [Amorphochlora amoebiformis]